MRFSPFETVAKHTCHHKINPAFLLTALLDALGNQHRNGNKGMTINSLGVTDVHGEIVALCANADPPRDDAPSSLLETLELALAHRQEYNEARVEAEGERAADVGEVTVNDVHRMLADAQKVLRLIVRESMNQLEADGVEASFAFDVDESWDDSA